MDATMLMGTVINHRLHNKTKTMTHVIRITIGKHAVSIFMEHFRFCLGFTALQATFVLC